MSVQYTNTGYGTFWTFYWLYFTYRINHFFPLALETYKSYLPESAKVEDLISHWDEIEINHKKIIDWKEIFGTVLPNESDVVVAPNNYKFILSHVNHSKMKHYQMLELGIPPHCLH